MYELKYWSGNWSNTGKTVTLTIQDPCEPPEKVNVPSAAGLVKQYTAGWTPATVKLPPTITVPKDCSARLSYRLDVPEAIKGLIKVTAGGDVTVGGIITGDIAKEWTIKIVALSPAGIEIGGTTWEWDLEFRQQEKKPLTEIVSTVGAISTGLFGAAGRTPGLNAAFTGLPGGARVGPPIIQKPTIVKPSAGGSGIKIGGPSGPGGIGGGSIGGNQQIGGGKG